MPWLASASSPSSTAQSNTGTRKGDRTNRIEIDIDESKSRDDAVTLGSQLGLLRDARARRDEIRGWAGLQRADCRDTPLLHAGAHAHIISSPASASSPADCCVHSAGVHGAACLSVAVCWQVLSSRLGTDVCCLHVQGELLMINQVICKVARDPDTMNRFDYSDKGWEAADRSVREVTRNHTQPHAPSSSHHLTTRRGFVQI